MPLNTFTYPYKIYARCAVSVEMYKISMNGKNTRSLKIASIAPIFEHFFEMKSKQQQQLTSLHKIMFSVRQHFISKWDNYSKITWFVIILSTVINLIW